FYHSLHFTFAFGLYKGHYTYPMVAQFSTGILAHFSISIYIHDAGGVKRIRIYSRGDAIRTTPSYPENVTGFFFRNYTQEYELLDTSDGNKERN
ncbi:hypothetical protein L4X55_18545, partial [Phocaeicola vulgatus]|nr:hypothetical protein [Phocaeicola vulgatus]